MFNSRKLSILMHQNLILKIVILAFSFFVFSCSPTSSSGGGTATTTTRYIFTTSASLTPNWGSLSAADTLCSNYASAGGLAGTFKAWISNGTTTASSRITDVGPWYLVGTSTIAANNLASLQTSLAVGVPKDQNGSAITPSNRFAWTGTTMPGGASAANNCQNWTSSSGADSGASFGITGSVNSAINVGCANGGGGLICVQQ